MRQFETELLQLPRRYHEAIRRYLNHATLPRDRALARLIAGLGHHRVIDAPLVLGFMERHCPPFAWGSPERVAFWEFIGGFETDVPGSRAA